MPLMALTQSNRLASQEATKTRKRGKAPKRYKTPLYDRMRRQAIKPTALWAKLTDAARRKLTTAGYDQQSWDNNCKEIVSVSHFDLLHTGGGHSPIIIHQVATVQRRRGNRTRMMMEDNDAFAKAVFNE